MIELDILAHEIWQEKKQRYWKERQFSLFGDDMVGYLKKA